MSFNTGFFIEQNTTPPVIQHSMLFDGVNEYVTAIHNVAYDFTNVQPFSISTWFKAPSFGGTKALASKRINGGAGWGITFTGTTINFQLVNTATTNQIWISVNPGLLINTWYHLVITYDGSSTAAGVKMYVNDVLQVSGIVIDNLVSSSASGSAIAIGRNAISGTFYFLGNVSTTRIWNIELPAINVTQEYNGGVMREIATSLTDLVFGWKGGQNAFCSASSIWVYPEETGLYDSALPYSINMEYVDRVLDVP